MATYNGTSGNDNITGTSSSDTINGNAGNDTLYGGSGNDTINGGTGSDTARFRGNFADYDITWDSTTRRYRIVDRRSGRDGTDLIWGVEYFQFADGTRSIANLVPGAGDGLILNGTTGADTLNGDVGYDQLSGGAGNDVLDGKAANDQLSGGEGDDQLIGGAGDDTIAGGAGTDTVRFTGRMADYQFTWDPVARTYTIRDMFSGRDGQDVVSGAEYFAFSDGTRSIAQLPLQAGDGVTLTGTAGNDTLTGGVGYDTLEGGDGNDELFGGAADDIISGGAGTDTVRFSGSLSAYQFTWDPVARKYTISDRRGQDGTDLVSGVEYFAFADGVRSIAQLPIYGGDGLILTGTAGDDTLSGGEGYDEIRGLAGNDVLSGGAADDLIDGGEGYDTVLFSGDLADYVFRWVSAEGGYGVFNPYRREDGGDLVRNVELFTFRDASVTLADLQPNGGDGLFRFGGAGNDHLDGYEGHDTLRGGDGHDMLLGMEGNDVLEGGAGNDWLRGSDGNDILGGGSGDDTFLAEFGDDVIEGGAGVDTAMFMASRADYAITWDAAARRYTFTSAHPVPFEGDDLVGGVELFSFADGTYTVSQLLANEGDGEVLVGTEQDDQLIGGAGFDVLQGLGGNDVLEGGDAADVLDGGAGHDALRGGAGNDRIIGGEGHDTVHFDGYRADYSVSWDAATRTYTITDNNAGSFGGPDDGTDTISGVEGFSFRDGIFDVSHLLPTEGDGLVLVGTQYDDYLVGGAGFDLLQGLGGQDVLDGGDAADVLEGGEGDDGLRGGMGNDRIVGGSGRDTAYFNGYRANYAVTWDAATRSYTLVDNTWNGSWNNDGTDIVSGVELFSFSDGIYNLSQLLPTEGDGLVLVGTDQMDNLVGDSGFDHLQGLDGQDFLDGLEANDVLDGGAGDDMLRGGAGNDRIIGGSGRDTAHFSGYRANYAVTWDAATRSYTLVDNTWNGGWNNDGTDIVSGVELFSFADGTYNLSQLLPNEGDGLVLTGTAWDDYLIGDAGFDNLQGLDGHDFLDGLEADDVLDGGAGDDMLRGGAGNDRIIGGSGRDTAHFSGYRANYAVTWDAATRSYTLVDNTWNGGWNNDGTDIVSGVELFSFADGTYNLSQLLPTEGDGLVLTGTAQQDFLTGDAGFDHLQGLDGNDSLDGAAADDVLEGGAGDDMLRGGAGNDRIDGGTGRDTAHFSGQRANYGVAWDAVTRTYTVVDNSWNGWGGPNDGTDVVSGVELFSFADGTYNLSQLLPTGGDGLVLTGTAQQDFLTGDAGFDVLQGLDGNDFLDGGDGADVLEGGAGDDDLRGGRGDDSLDGGEGGFDRAHFAGNSWEYVVSWDAQRRVYTLADTVAGRDGVDTVGGVEFFYFQDRVSGWGNLVPGEGDGLQLTGTDGDDYLYGSDGYDTIHGGAGNDTIGGGGGRDIVDGGDGDDTIEGGAGHQIDGGTGTDTLGFHGYLHDHVVAWDQAAGRFSITSHYWEPGTVTYASNIEYLRFFDGTIDAFSAVGGTWPGQHLVGSEQGDYLVATQGNDTLDGMGGNDTMRAERGDDVLNGGEGDDLLVGSAGNDVLDGGAGQDRAVYYGARSEYVISWDEATQRFTIADTVAGRDGTDVVSSVEQFSFNSYSEFYTDAQLRAAPGSDATIQGTPGMDWLQGGTGNDTLLGFEGDDTLYGAEGNDVIDGGQGNDVLQGGEGADVFVLRAEGLDFIPSFVAGQDQIRLAGPLSAGMAAGALAPEAFQAAQHSVAGSADVRVLLNLANGHLLYDPDGFGSAEAVHIAVLDVPGLVGTPGAGDFRIA